MARVSKKNNDKVIAVIVTYNRKELLKECIQAILKQSYKNLDVLIVDNASTDGTFEYIKKLVKNNVNYQNTGTNLGGAGGFNFGIKEAVKKDYKYIWIMDDDTIPKKDSLQELINADKLLKGDYGFLSSIVLWEDGKICEMNKQKIKNPWHTKGELLGDGLLKTYHSTFVSFFTTIDVVKKVGLPIKEFFIWGDDVEYTNRISKKFENYIVGKSKVLHKIKNNVGSNIAVDDVSRISRYKYAYRNEVYIAKTNGIKGIIRQFFKINLHIYRVIKYSKKNKLKKINIIIASSIKGLFFNPKIEFVEEVI